MKADVQELEGPISEILSRLEQARSSDDRAEAQVKRYGTWFVVCLVVGLIGWFPLTFVVIALDSSAPLLLSPIALVAAIVLKVLQVRARRFDLDDRRLDATLHVLRMLAADTPQGARVRLRIDFRGYRSGGEVVAKKGGLFSSVNASKYVQEWLRLTGALLDGTRYQLAVTDVVSRKTKSKRKYTKVKEQFRSRIVLSVRVRPRHGGIEPVVAALETDNPPVPLQRLAVGGRDQTLRVQLATPITRATKGRYRSTPADPALLVSGDMILSALLWTWDGIGRSLKRTA